MIIEKVDYVKENSVIKYSGNIFLVGCNFGEIHSDRNSLDISS